MNDGVMVWDGSVWSNLNWGPAGLIVSYQNFNGNLYLCGDFSNLKDSLNDIAYLDYPTFSNDKILPLSFTIFPNPASNLATVSFNISEESQLLIINQYGKRIKSYALPPSLKIKTVDVSDLSNGMYLMTLQSVAQQISQNVMVQR
ncbi:MAG: T9SS type A sorting domain-containing protein [Chitinophagales bacterium]|nr:T9SS type A sorting domain-containing protein [Chitinophagales bacterium]